MGQTRAERSRSNVHEHTDTLSGARADRGRNETTSGVEREAEHVRYSEPRSSKHEVGHQHDTFLALLLRAFLSLPPASVDFHFFGPSCVCFFCF